jgi:probable rRNA maturation factor
VRIVDADEGRALNREYRGKDYATNVLTFDYSARAVVVADLVLCAPVVRARRASAASAAGALRPPAGARHAACAGPRPRASTRRRARDGGARVRTDGALGFADPYRR